MTPQILVQTARTVSPKLWKGQQTVIRRLSRTKGLPEKTMHEALRTAAKLYKSQIRIYKMVAFRPNKDTPPDLRAEYLRTPYAFGFNAQDDLLGWARQASNATLLKMETFTEVATLVLFERNRQEVIPHIRRLAETKAFGDFGWLQDRLSLFPWNEKQLEIMATCSDSSALNIWANKFVLLDHFVVQAERHNIDVGDKKWLDTLLDRYNFSTLLSPCQSVRVQKAALAQGFRHFFRCNKQVQESSLEAVWTALNVWHARKPTETDCLDLANMLDEKILEIATKSTITPDWEERLAVIVPWLSMVCPTMEQSQKALTLYGTVDPALLTFSTISNAMADSTMDDIDNASELLCP